MRNLSIVVCRRPPLPLSLCLSLSEKNVKITVWCLGHSTNWFCFCIAHLPDAIKESYCASQLKEQLEQMKEFFINTMIVARQQIIIGPPYDRSLNGTAGDESKSLLLFQGITTGLSHIRYLSGELDSVVSLRCEIAQLPPNAVVRLLNTLFTFSSRLDLHCRSPGFIDRKYQRATGSNGCPYMPTLDVWARIINVSSSTTLATKSEWTDMSQF